MNTFFILIVSILICIVNYGIGNNDALNPAFIFSCMNIINLFACSLIYGFYAIDITLKTMVVLLSGMLIFTLFNLLFRRSISSNQKGIKMGLEYIRVSNTLLLFFTLVLLIVGVSIGRFILEIAALHGGGGNFITSIGIYDSISKFANDRISVPRVYSLGAQFVKASAYIIAAISINNYYCQKRLDKRFIAYIILYFFYSIMSGGRSEMIRFVMANIADIIIVRRRLNGSFKKGNIKVLVRLFCSAVGIVFISFPMLRWMGKGAVVKKSSYGIFLARYIGAPIVNLSHAVENGVSKSVLFGEQTFQGVYSLLSRVTGSSSFRYNLYIPTSRIQGLDFGNVYTMYYMFLEDFGYSGLLLTIPICLYYYISYSKLVSNNSKKTVISLNLFVYSYMFNALTMLLFSNRFYENMFSWNFIKLYLSFWLIWFVIRRVRIKWKSISINSGIDDFL